MKIRPFLHHLNLRTTRLLPKLTLTSKITISVFAVISLSFLIKSTIAISTTDSMDSTGSNSATNTTNTIEPSELTIDTTNLQGYIDKQTAITKGNNQESWINESLASNVVSINQAMAGTLPSDYSTWTTGWIPGGIIGFTNNAIASLYQPPASGVQYIAQSVGSFLGKPSYAADNGFGFNKLSGILDIWKTMRNTVYTLISLFFIIVGIMIMLRVKINPQTTVTIQSAIPQIISALILVTFSYAIAGLLIDFSNVFLGIALTLINKTDISLKDLMSLDFWKFWQITNGYLVSSRVTNIATAIGGLIGGAGIGLGVGFGGIGALGGVIVGALSFGLIFLSLYIFAFIQIFKLFFGLAKSYITIIIHIIIAPIEIGMGAIPGSKVNFTSWLNQIIAQIAVFPSVAIFLVFSIFLCEQLIWTDTMWAPPMMGNGRIISAIVGLACVSIMSKIPQLVPEFIFKLKPSPIGRAISDNTKGIIGITKQTTKHGVRGAAQYGANQSYGMKAKEIPIFKVLRQVGELTGYIKENKKDD